MSAAPRSISSAIRCSHLFLSLAIAFLAGLPNRALARDWINSFPTGNWSDANSWSPAGVPGAGETVRLLLGGATNHTVNYDYAGAPVTLGSLEINNLLGFGTFFTLNIPSGNLTTQFNQFIGTNGLGIVDQTGGTNTALTGGIFLGSAAGTGGIYNLSSGGILNTVGMSIGSTTGGEGILSVANGTLTSTANITVFNSLASALNFSGGTITTRALDFDGNPARFNWTGGDLHITGPAGASIGGTGTTSLGNTLTLGAGKKLTVDNALTINVASGAFLALSTGDVASGLTIGQLDLNGNPFLLSWTSGLLHVTGAGGAAIGGPTNAPSWLGFDLTVGNNQQLWIDNTLKVVNSGGAALNLNGSGFVTVGALDLSGDPSRLNWTAGNLRITGAGGATVGGAGPSSLGNGFTLGANRFLTIDNTLSVNGSMSQTGGTVSTGFINVGGTYTLGGGSFQTYYTSAVNSGGTFTQSGGTANFGVFSIGGNYALSGGTYIGNFENTISAGGSFTQTGGAASFFSPIAINGAYSLSNGSVSLLGLGIFNNVGVGGTLTQTGGLVNVGYSFDVNGTYSLSAGSLIAQNSQTAGGSIYVNNGGTFLQSGGFFRADRLGVFGNYSISGGSLLVDKQSVYVGASVGNTASFNQTGGTVSIINNSGSSCFMYLANQGDKGIYSISGGALNTDGIFVGLYTSTGTVGSVGDATLNVTGDGVVNTGYLAVYSKANTSINLSGGTINTNALAFYNGASSLNWGSGTLNIIQDVSWDPQLLEYETGAAFGASRTIANNQRLKITGNETLGGLGAFALTLASGGTHEVTSYLTISPTGTLTQNAGSTLITGNTIQAGGAVNGTLTNLTTFTYQSGAFNGRLVNQGALSLGSNFTAGNGIENDFSMSIGPGQTVTANGAGFDNRGSLTLSGGILAGNGPATNSAGGTMQGTGTVRPAFTNNGTLYLFGTMLFTGPSVTNNGTLIGNGTLTGAFLNAAGGLMDVTNSLGVTNAWTNAGSVVLRANAAPSLGGGAITNTGTIEGQGFINATVANTTGVVRASGGTLRLAGAGSTNPVGGRIEAATGATVMVTQGLATNAGTIALTGGAFDNNARALSNTGSIAGFGEVRTSTLTNAGGALISVGAGDMNVLGAVVNNGTVNVTSGRTITFFNNVSGPGPFTGLGKAVFLANYSPGASPAAVNFSGNATLGGGSALAIELGGTTGGAQYDQMKVAGLLELGGTLNVSLINGFNPAAGNAFDILDWSSVAGTFSAFSLPTLSGGLGWNTSQLYTTGVLSVVSVGIPGDYNNNGAVDAADYVLWRKGGALTNEVDAPGTTNAADYAAWRARFGAALGPGVGSSVAVPEPAGALLLLLGMVAFPSILRG